MNPEDLIGQRFGKIRVLSIHRENSNGVSFVCVCDCGREVIKLLSRLHKYGIYRCSRSCPIKQYGRKPTHGMKNTSEYRVWGSMHSRCHNPNVENYEIYGGRGITVQDSWKSFENFYADMGSRPTPNHSLDRIDVNGNYCKTNCRWATNSEQQRNTRTNRVLEFNGVSKTLVEWSEEYGVPQDTLWHRLDEGWSLEESLTRPVQRRKSQECVQQIKQLRVDRVTPAEISRVLNIPDATVRRIIRKISSIPL